MNKAKSIAAGVLSLWAVAMTNAQQVVKRITNTTGNTLVEMFVVRNGTSLPNTTWSSNFDTWTSDNKWNVIIYNPAITNTYTKDQLPSWSTPHGTEQVGNGTFLLDGNITNNTNNTNFIANWWSWATLNITIPQEDGEADSTQDTNTLNDLLYTRFVLPKTLNGGGAIPNWLMVKLISRLAKDISTWWTAIWSRQITLQRDLPNQIRVPRTTDRTWSTPIALESIGTDWQLGSESFDTDISAQTALYPNPAIESVSLDNNNNISGEKFDVEIYDITGKKVMGTGSYTEWQPLDISMLASGQYILKAKWDDMVATKSLIKN